jgi:hypothetical protein
MNPHGWITRLMEDPAFLKKMEQRWFALRQGVLADAEIEQRIDSFAMPLHSGAADRNFERWNILNVERPFPKPYGYITIKSAMYLEQITALKRFIRQRAVWMDKTLGVD